MSMRRISVYLALLLLATCVAALDRKHEKMSDLQLVSQSFLQTEERARAGVGIPGMSGGGAPPAGGGQTGGGAAGGGGSFGPCKTCVFVVERIKKGTNMLLPSICTEVFDRYGAADYASCHQVLQSLEENGNNVRYWLFEGCYKYEMYQAKEWIKPCPSHVMCSVLKNLEQTPFCTPLPMENPFGG